MSLKSLLSEINFGIWLIETSNVVSYQEIITGLRSGAFTNEEASMYHNLMGQPSVNPSTKQPELKDKVAIITFDGELTKSSANCNIGADKLIDAIQMHNVDDTVKGFIFKMDGPGGNASVIPLFSALKSIIKKPVVSYVEKACSLHYYISAILSDHIMMANDFTAEVGSIGAMIMFEKPEREIVMVRPKQSKDKNEEIIQALNGNTELLEKKLEPLAIQFQNDVKKYRPQVSEEVLFGKVLYAKDAIKAGLADSIGTIEMAYNLVLAKAELNN